MSSSISKPSFGEGALVALVMSTLGSIAVYSLGLLFFSGTLLSSVIVMLGGGYLVYLITRSQRKSGKLVATLLISSVALICVILPIGISVTLTILLTAIWLVRSFYFRCGFLDSVFDLGLTLVSFAAAVTAGRISKSHFLAFWTFFIVQALHVYLPSMQQKQSYTGEQPSDTSGDRFRRAHDNAQSALNRMHRSAI